MNSLTDVVIRAWGMLRFFLVVVWFFFLCFFIKYFVVDLPVPPSYAYTVHQDGWHYDSVVQPTVDAQGCAHTSFGVSVCGSYSVINNATNE